MSKRQLDSKYKDLVDYVNDKQSNGRYLTAILKDAIEVGDKPFSDDSKLWQILNDLYTIIITDKDTGALVKTIVDIYNDNYELQEPKYYWKLNLQGVGCTDYYAVALGESNKKVGISEFKMNQSKFTRDELINALANTGTSLIFTDFTPVEV